MMTPSGARKPPPTWASQCRILKKSSPTLQPDSASFSIINLTNGSRRMAYSTMCSQCAAVAPMNLVSDGFSWGSATGADDEGLRSVEHTDPAALGRAVSGSPLGEACNESLYVGCARFPSPFRASIAL